MATTVTRSLTSPTPRTPTSKSTDREAETMSDTTNHSVIKNVGIIDGTGAPLARDRAVITEGRRITWIGPESDLPPGASDRAVDGHGGTLLPGLINCHVHLCNDGSADFFGQVQRDTISITRFFGYVNRGVRRW